MKLYIALLPQIRWYTKNQPSLQIGPLNAKKWPAICGQKLGAQHDLTDAHIVELFEKAMEIPIDTYRYL